MKNKTTAGFTAFFLGIVGAHRFYLGQIWFGILYVLLAPTFISAVIGVIDAIIFFTISKDAFNKQYNQGCIELTIHNSTIERLNQENNDIKTALNKQLLDLTAHRDSLLKYQGIVDADSKANEILLQAKIDSDNTLLDAKRVIDEAKIEAQNMKIKATNELDKAVQESHNIIAEANKKAEEIAGDAYKALQNVDILEKKTQAIKNIINGYGNEYLVPTFTLLDDLAEEFGHTEAGEELKMARDKVRSIVKNGLAAQCDYVEINRKETAINFVLDAFNGKVDSILGMIKKDNFGILKQKIQDAYNIVNANGKAFRNAVITEDYCNARQNELKWAVIVNELKLKEREEQRLIKEQIREEERARREFEKAIKEAEKEEEILKKAIEKAQKEVESANAAQKEKYESKLLELNEKLRLAEEKNQRALSMAQQTKSGNVYIISNIGSFGEDVYKIGMTRRLEPLDRIRELGDASVPFEFDVHSMIYSNDAPSLERELHKRFLLMQVNKVNPRKEFFRVSLSDIKAEIDKMGLEVKWTMTAEAKQYRESLAIEKSLQLGNLDKEEFLKYQNRLSEEIEIEEEDLVTT